MFEGIRIIDELNILKFPLKLNILSPIGLVGILLKLKGYKYEINLKSEDFEFVFDANGVYFKGDNLDWFSKTILSIDIKNSAKECNFKNQLNNLVVEDEWANMNKLASLTYVKSTDYSRIYGAGSIDDFKSDV